MEGKEMRKAEISGCQLWHAVPPLLHGFVKGQSREGSKVREGQRQLSQEWSYDVFKTLFGCKLQKSIKLTYKTKTNKQVKVLEGEGSVLEGSRE